MKILAKCPRCKQRRFLIKVRQFQAPPMGNISSKEEMCGVCADAINDLIKAKK